MAGVPGQTERPERGSAVLKRECRGLFPGRLVEDEYLVSGEDVEMVADVPGAVHLRRGGDLSEGAHGGAGAPFASDSTGRGGTVYRPVAGE